MTQLVNLLDFNFCPSNLIASRRALSVLISVVKPTEIAFVLSPRGISPKHFMSTPADKIFEQLSNDFKSIQKTRDSYTEKYGRRRYNRTNRRVYRTKLDDIIDVVAPSAPRDGKQRTKRQRRELAIRMHQQVKERAYQVTLPFIDEVVASPAEIVPFHGANLQEKIKERFCPELDQMEKDYGGINRYLMRQRIIFGCDT